MTFKASQLSLQRGFEAILAVANQQKTYLGNWAVMLSGNITAIDGLMIVSSINQATTAMDQYASLPGMASYAQTQFGDATYNVTTEYSNMRAALIAVRDWLVTNIPANAITVSNGAQVGATYTPAQTAPLLSLVNAASATIS